jgi:hypothetical protein
MRPQYLKRPIGTVTALSAALRVSEHVLRHAEGNLDMHYSPYEIPKADGKKRQIVIPSLHLKTIQKRINKEIFSHVQYPPYLYGGVSGKDYVRNASAHEDAEVLIALDVRNFYPSISRERVANIFQHFCKFGADVSDLLAGLTTYQNKVPQGACTSSHLANLVLHDVESSMVSYCEGAGLIYTRLLDDITISSKKPLPPKFIKKIVDMISTMLKRKGFRLKGQKTNITSKSNPENLMEVTGLWLNRGMPRVNSFVRRSIRVEVFQCTQSAKKDRTTSEYHQAYASASGKVAMLSYLGHGEAGRLRKSLEDILPIYGQGDLTKTQKMVGVLRRSTARDREKYAYNVRYYKVMQRINIVSRTDPALAKRLRQDLADSRPANTSNSALYDEPI